MNETEREIADRQNRLATLEQAANAPDGIFREHQPARGDIFNSLVESELLEKLKSGFSPLLYRITEKGRAFVKANSAPIDW